MARRCSFALITVGAVLMFNALGACKLRIKNGAEPDTDNPLACEYSEQCPMHTSPCISAMCLEGSCVHVPAPQAPLPPEDQRKGDCKHLYCDGEGGITSSAARYDLPPSDKNPCTVAVCDVDVPKQDPTDVGSRCGEKGICNGGGLCGVCLPEERRCEKDAVTICDKRGQWTPPQACSPSKPLCSKARCVGVTQMATGAAHACARFEDGSVRCWGANNRGQLGSNGLAGAAGPAWANGFVQYDFGPRHACAARADGTAWCWGANDFGQMGVDTYVSSQAASLVQGLAKVAQLAVGTDHSCALDSAGKVHCWGRNDRGQLGSGKAPTKTLTKTATEQRSAFRPDPQAISGLSDGGKLLLDADHSCVRRGESTLVCWGLTNYALPQSIEPPPPPDPNAAPDAPEPDPALQEAYKEHEAATSRTPTAIAGLGPVVQIGCGDAHSCARLEDGSVKCWGANDKGQLGNGSTRHSFKPVAVAAMKDAAELAVGADFSCVRHKSGNVSCWGANDQGQLGTGSTAASAKAATIATLVKVRALHAGDAFACATLEDLQLMCWGANNHGQLADGTQKPARQPKLVRWR